MMEGLCMVWMGGMVMVEVSFRSEFLYCRLLPALMIWALWALYVMVDGSWAVLGFVGFLDGSWSGYCELHVLVLTIRQPTTIMRGRGHCDSMS